MRRLTWWGKFLVVLALNLALAQLAGAQSAIQGVKILPPASSSNPATASPASPIMVLPNQMMNPNKFDPANQRSTNPAKDSYSIVPSKKPDTQPAAAKPTKAKPAVREPGILTDYGRYLGEFQAAGAFRFYDNTEAMLRTAQFEESLMRYRFLKGQIQGKVDYYGLLASVNRRIKFLQKQLQLRDSEVAAIPARKPRISKLKPAVKLPETKLPEKPEAVIPKPPGTAGPPAGKPIPPVSSAAGPPAQVPSAAAPLPPAQIPAATPLPSAQAPAATPLPPAQAPVAAPLPSAQKPPVVTTDSKPQEEEKAEEEKDKEEKPAVPLSFWQRMKIKLHLGKKPDSAGDKKADSVTIE